MPHRVVQTVRVLNDTLRVVLADPVALPAPVVNVVPETKHWWSMPLFQTLMGGLLAVGGGMVLELFRTWLRGHRLRSRLSAEVLLVNGMLHKLYETLAVPEREGFRVTQELATAMDGYDRLADVVASVLTPSIVHEVKVWYRDVEQHRQKMTGLLATLGNVLTMQPSSEADIDRTRVAISEHREKLKILAKRSELICFALASKPWKKQALYILRPGGNEW